MPSIDHPDAHDFVELMVAQNNLTMWTNAQGQVVKYDSTTQRADVQLVMSDGTAENPVEIPLLHAIPVVWPKGGNSGAGNLWSTHAPLEPGNPVMVWFLVHNIGEWLQDGLTGRIARKKARFSLSSAVCYPGVSHKGNLIPTAATDPNAYVIRAALTVISDLGSPEFVALANLVNARLATIQSTYDAHTHAHPVGPGVTAIPNSLIGPLSSVASTTLKAE